MQMAQKLDIMYVNFYTDGSAARKVAPAFPVTQPKPKTQVKRKTKRITIFIDPVAVCSLVVAAVMLIMMVVGLNQLQTANDQAQRMEDYVSSLTQKNQELKDSYYSDMDLEQIRQTALALGMVPKDQVAAPDILLEQDVID